MSFFENLNFSSSNEDGQTELDALAGAQRIVCLTGSGTRPLDLLMSDAEEVIALDINPAQNALLHLKIAAILSLEHDEFLAFLGITKNAPASAYFERVRAVLSPAMQDYWDKNRRLAESGIWYAGKWERLLGWNAWFLRLFRGKAINKLMSAATVEEQAKIWKHDFNVSKLRKTVELIGRQWVWKWVMREPAGNFLPSPQAVSERLATSFEQASQNYLFRESDFATLILKGAISADAALPVHLRPENYQRLRSRLSRLRVELGGLSDMAALSLSHVDGFSLSDFGSYVGQKDYATCWQGIIEVAAPGAKFCERIFMNDMPLPAPSIHEDRALSSRLTKSDNAIIYIIRAGTIGG